MRWWMLALVALGVSLGLVGQADAESKLAFVVGIDAYPHLPAEAQLQRAVTDAESMAASLERLGFVVTKLGRDVTVNQDIFLKRFAAWTRNIQPGDTALFYFAGHGVGINGANYLVPADIPDLADADEFLFRAHALAEAEIRNRIQARSARVVLLMLDACRNNPFSSAGRSIALLRGLEPIDSSKGVLTIYAAGYGQTALDRLSDTGDSNPNSIFTRVVLSEIEKPGLNLLDFSEDVRDKVATLAQTVGHEQVPAVDNQLLGGRSVYLAGNPTNPTSLPPPSHEPPSDEVAWRYVQGTTDPILLRRFITDYPLSSYKDKAQDRLAVLERPQITTPPSPPEPPSDEMAWRYVQETGNPDILRKFMTDFPTSHHKSEAETRLAALEKPPAAMTEPGLTPPVSNTRPADEVLWDKVATSETPQPIRDFIDLFPQSGFLSKAQERLSILDKNAWTLTTMDNPAKIRAYLTAFPNGQFYQIAAQRLAALEATKPNIAAPKSAPALAPMRRLVRRPIPIIQHRALQTHQIARAHPNHCFGFGGEQYCQ